ncbi:MAG TPA: OB-fold domain-containing protein [Burkholderiales bacterium]|nr:OB-fold domain-containing protein [Burkholderiales bacterium]
MSTGHDLADWTRGEAGIVYQRCGCGAAWYFRRAFCPRCGRLDPQTVQASGRGTVYASSLNHRAPTETLRPYAPYLIVLVDAEEGFRMMAHGDRTLRIGERVQARFVDFGGTLVPYFEKAEKK